MFRPENGVNIRQDTKTSFFNANDLIELYTHGKKSDRPILEYLRTNTTRRYIEELMKTEDLNDANSTHLDNTVISTKRGKNGGTWMHPYLFIDFAMWLSPEFKVKVVRWVYDNLIKLRIESGDTFLEVNEALFEANPRNAPFVYSNEARMINKIIFGKSDSGQRNNASEEQLNKLKSMQKADVVLIQEGKDYFERYNELCRIYKYI